MAGKVAVVTGGGSGIGAETARQFAIQGATVIVCDINVAGGEEVVQQIDSMGGTASFVELDVVDEAAWETLVSNVQATHGKLDVLANIAGVGGRNPNDPDVPADAPAVVAVTDQKLADWNRIMDINSTGTFLGTKHGARAMASTGGGSIINISSICGLVGAFSTAAYHASKGAVRLMTKSAALQCASDGIRVNSIHPGFIDTPMTAPAHTNNALVKERIDATPLRRFGSPYDVAMGCVYLACDESAFVTGAELVIDGGLVAA
ncbi:MAG: glucose 1-dehydrogenase [Pseudomonadota bacterium]